MSVIEIQTTEQFDNLIETGLVCIDFWAPWCGPCLQFMPIFEDAAAKCSNVTFVKINVDNLQEIAHKYSVRSIPTIILLEDGKNKKTQVGPLNTAGLLDFVNL